MKQQHLDNSLLPYAKQVVETNLKVPSVPQVPMMKNLNVNFDKIVLAKVAAAAASEKFYALPKVVEFKKNSLIPPVPPAPLKLRNLRVNYFEKVKLVHLNLPKVFVNPAAPPVPVVKRSIDFEKIKQAHRNRNDDLIRPIKDFCINRNIPNVPKKLTLFTKKVTISTSLNLIPKVEDSKVENVPPSPEFKVDFSKIEATKKIFLEYFDTKKVIVNKNEKVPEIPKIIHMCQAAVIGSVS